MKPSDPLFVFLLLSAALLPLINGAPIESEKDDNPPPAETPSPDSIGDGDETGAQGPNSVPFSYEENSGDDYPESSEEGDYGTEEAFGPRNSWNDRDQNNELMIEEGEEQARNVLQQLFWFLRLF